MKIIILKYNNILKNIFFQKRYLIMIETSLVLIPLIFMVINISVFLGLIGYAAYCGITKACENMLPPASPYATAS
jgi:hypothetical protein